MAYEPINGTAPVPKRRGFNKKSLLVMLLLASITAAAIVIIVLFTTTNVFSSRSQTQTTSVAAVYGLNSPKYDSQKTRLNGDVVCEDFAADAKQASGTRNFQVVSANYTADDGKLVTVSGDKAYDDAVSSGKKVTPTEVMYYGQTQKWNEIGSSYICGLTAQKVQGDTDNFLKAEPNVKQSLLTDPAVFPVKVAQISQTAATSSRLFVNEEQVIGFYDFLFNYFNHGPELLELTTISFGVLAPGDNTLGDYQAPARAMEIKISTGELYLINNPPTNSLLYSNENWRLARRVNAIWPVLSHEYGHHMVETYGKRVPLNGDFSINPAGLSYTSGSIDEVCSQLKPEFKIRSLNNENILRCDSSIFNSGLMDGVLNLSGYSQLLAVKDVNFGTALPKSQPFASAEVFPNDYYETGAYFDREKTPYVYTISNTIWTSSNVPDPSLANVYNSYRFSYDEILARLYNLASAPFMNSVEQYGRYTVNATNFKQEYDLHKQINDNEFPLKKPMLQSSPEDQKKLMEIGALFEQMRASGAPISYIGGSEYANDRSNNRTVYGTSPNKEKYMLLRDSYGNYSTKRIYYGVEPESAVSGAKMPLLKIDNSMQLVSENASSLHTINGTSERYEWYDSPLLYKSSALYSQIFATDPNNEKTFFASFDASDSDALLKKDLVGFTNSAISGSSTVLPAGSAMVSLSAAPYSKAFYQPDTSSSFSLRTNATGVVKRMTKIVGSTLYFQTNPDDFSALVNTAANTIRFVRRY